MAAEQELCAAPSQEFKKVQRFCLFVCLFVFVREKKNIGVRSRSKLFAVFLGRFFFLTFHTSVFGGKWTVFTLDCCCFCLIAFCLFVVGFLGWVFFSGRGRFLFYLCCFCCCCCCECIGLPEVFVVCV